MPAHLPLPVARALLGISYPTSRSEIISHIVDHGGQPQILELLRRLPHRDFQDEGDLARELPSMR